MLEGMGAGRLIEAVAAADALSELAEDFVPMLEEELGAHGSLLFEFGDDGRPRGVSGSLAPHLATYNATLFGEDPLQKVLPTIDPRQTTVALEEAASFDELRRSVAFHEFYRPLGVERLLGLWPTGQRYGTAGMVGLIVGRPLRERAFGERERRVLEDVLPAVRGLLARERRARAHRADVTEVARAHGLTPAEAKILSCLARGLDNKSIAAELHVSEPTVKTHVRRVLEKLGVESRTQAALYAHGVLER